MNFFVLQNPRAGEGSAVTDFLPVDGSRTGEAPRCSVCGKYVGMLPLLSPVLVELETWGAEFGDIAFGPAMELVTSDRFLRLYQASGLTGLIDVSPVEVAEVKSHQKLRGPVPRYHCCRATRSRAVIDDAKSGLERESPWTCQECRNDGIKCLKRIVLETNSWSGEDVFIARGLPGRILTSENFEEF